MSFLHSIFKEFYEKKKEELCGWEKAFAFATTSLSIYSGGGSC